MHRSAVTLSWAGRRQLPRPPVGSMECQLTLRHASQSSCDFNTGSSVVLWVALGCVFLGYSTHHNSRVTGSTWICNSRGCCALARTVGTALLLFAGATANGGSIPFHCSRGRARGSPKLVIAGPTSPPLVRKAALISRLSLLPHPLFLITTHPTTIIIHPTSIQHPSSSIQHPSSSIQHRSLSCSTGMHPWLRLFICPFYCYSMMKPLKYLWTPLQLWR
jgi:hypothetical protein